MGERVENLVSVIATVIGLDDGDAAVLEWHMPGAAGRKERRG